MAAEFMKIEDALEIVLELARENVIDPEPDEIVGDAPLKEQAEKQQTALDTVEDFLTNVISEGRQKDVSSIIATAKLVILHWDSGDLAGSVRCLDAAIKEYEGE